MKFRNRRVTALAAVALVASLALTACGGSDSDGGSDGGSGGGSGEAISVTFLPKNLGNPYFDTSDAGGKKAVEEFGGTYARGRPRRRARPTPRCRSSTPPPSRASSALVVSANDPEGALRRPQRGAATPAPRSSPSTPTPTRTAATSSSTRPTAEGIAKVQVDLIAEQIGDAGEVAILSAAANATNQNAWIDLMKKDLADEPPEHQARRHRLRRRRRPDVVRQDRGAAADPPGPQGHHLADHGRHRGRGSLPVDLGRQGQGRADRSRHPEPDA